MANKPKIFVGMPCGNDTIKAKTAFSLIHALKALQVDYDFFMRMGCDIIGGRTGIAHEAVRRKASHLLFVAHDMFFPPDTIQKLLNHGKDIVGATYNFRRLPLQSLAIPFSDVTPTDTLFKCQALGTGMLLIRTEVFEKIPEPWFKFSRDEHGELISGEDTYFCQEAIKVGYDVWADPNLGVRHLGEFYF